MGASVEGSEASGGDSEEEKEEGEEEEEEEEETEEQETTEVSRAREKSAPSEAEEGNSFATSSKSSSQGETHGKKRRAAVSDTEKSEDAHTLSWVSNALDTSIKIVDELMIRYSTRISQHSSPESCLPALKRVSQAAMLLVKNTDAAISLVKGQQSYLDKKALEGKLAVLRQQLEHTVQQSHAKFHAQATLLRQARSEKVRQSKLFHEEMESLKQSYKLEKEGLIARHIQERSDLKRQLEEEKDKSICCVCQEKPRDTIILPCLHFQYCFSCLLRHRDLNSNTCPTCRGPIHGLNMSSYLATQ